MNKKIEQLKQAKTDEEKERLLKKYWGRDAYCYSDHYWLPKGISWGDVCEVLTSLDIRSVSTYLEVNKDSFTYYSWEQMLEEENEAKRKWGICDALEVCREYHAFWDFVAESNKNGFVYAEICRLSPDKFVARKVLKEGSHGDEDGFGVEPDTWISAVLDRDGHFIQPFYLGYY
ncbi:hypothetical protein [Parabacteroides timonensis]|uniref:hypothetical protein n=1 Tax=Parabacteroides timonensis TaxID=1871013 RepID=UPI00094E9B71|nr:hypothetical protein [Parabacteroides timonensis]